MQRFKPKRRLRKIAILKLIIFIILIIIVFRTIKLISNNLSYNNLIKIIINDNRYLYKDTSDTNIFSKTYNYAKQNIINKPDSMLVGNMQYVSNIKKEQKAKEIL